MFSKQLLTFSFVALSSLGANAEDDFLDMNLEQLLQVTVTGSTLRDESLKTVPSVVTVFTHEQIAALGMDYLYELLTLVPGYQFKRTADSGINYGFSARGRRNSAQVREVLLMVDGRRFTNPRSGGSDILLPLFPLAQIERVEVISGPGSALYGSSAFTGVVNIITRKQQTAVSVAGGSDDRRSIDLLAGKVSGDWETSLFAHAYEDQGQTYLLRDISTSEPIASSDPFTSVNLDLGLRYKRTQLRLTYNRADASDFYSVERIHNNYNDNRLVFSQLSLEQGFSIGETLESKATLSVTRGDQLIHAELADAGDLLALSEPPSEAPFLVNAVLVSESYQLGLANDWSISEVASSQFGFELREDNEAQAILKSNYDLQQFIDRDYPIASFSGIDHETQLGTEDAQQSIGVYGQYLRQMSDTTNLTLGLRYDSYSNIADHVSPRLGVVQQLTANQTLKLLYGEAFRAPTLSELGLINNTRLIGNPDLEHEIVKTWDLIWIGTWQQTSLSLNGFYSDYEQPILAGIKGTTRTYINGVGEHSSGLSMETSQQLGSQWLVRLTYSYFLDLPDSAFREADQLSSVMLNYKSQSWSWNLAGVYQNETQTLAATEIAAINTRNVLDDFWIVNTKLGYQLTSATAINLQIKNLLDETYFSPAQGNGIAFGIPNRGRETSVELEMRF